MSVEAWLKSSDGIELYSFIKEQRGIMMVEKVHVILKDVKEHDYTLVQWSNGFALKQGEKLSHSFNVKEIRCIEAKLTWDTQDMEALENNQKSSIFKGIHKQHINKRRRKKENHKKSNEGKRKQIESNVQRVYGICVFPQFLVHPPSLPVP